MVGGEGPGEGGPCLVLKNEASIERPSRWRFGVSGTAGNGGLASRSLADTGGGNTGKLSEGCLEKTKTRIFLY